MPDTTTLDISGFDDLEEALLVEDVTPTIASGTIGPPGPAGADGLGVPPGGTTAQVLAKASNVDNDTEWVDQTGGGGGGLSAIDTLDSATIDFSGDGSSGDPLTAIVKPDSISTTQTDNTVATAASVTAEASARAAADALLIPLTQKAAANGVATLGADSLIPSAQLPPITITSVQTVASQAAMLALTAQVGDVAHRTDLDPDGFFILTAEPASTLGNWTQITAPGAVTSVDAMTGTVSLASVYQPLNSDLTAIAALATTAFGRNLLALADAAALRTAAALGALATLSTVGTTQIDDNAVTNAKLEQMAEATFKMRAAGSGTGDPIDGSVSNAKTALDYHADEITADPVEDLTDDTVGGQLDQVATLLKETRQLDLIESRALIVEDFFMPAGTYSATTDRLGQYGWKPFPTGAAGTGITVTANSDPTTVGFGYILLTTNVGSTGYTGVHLGQQWLRVGQAWDIRFRVRLPQGGPAAGTIDLAVYVGLGENTDTNAEPVTGAYFRVSQGAQRDYWHAVTASSGGTRSATDTGVAHATTMQKLRITCDGAGTIRFYIGGVLEHTETTTLPSSTVGMHPMVMIAKTLGTSTRTVQVDYMVLMAELGR